MNKSEIRKKIFKVRKQNISNRLVINFKYILKILRKEKEIDELNQNHFKLKDEIEINQKNYEKLIDEAANEISSFVEKANLENLS